MNKRISVAFVISVLIMGTLSAQGKVDLTGTWEGETYVEGGPVLMLTLVLEHKNAVITGNLNDDAGYIDSEISEAKLENDVFTFKAVAQAPEGEVILSFKVTVAGDKMEGDWESDNGVYLGSWSASRNAVE
ncbi:MAG: hypothetical protein JXB23_13335 [Candidatus Aminicenantes bacterium]|nr:hypothetical protein [Candidatus Aminicenantes bacterium]